jgi:hypothetical protein
LRAKGFFCNLDVLYGSQGKGNLQLLIQNFFFSAVILIQFLVIKSLDPDWIRIRIGIQSKMLDPDPDEMNADPQPWFFASGLIEPADPHSDSRSRKARMTHKRGEKSFKFKSVRRPPLEASPKA